MHIFTFIVDYDGGTYLKQALGDNVEDAIHTWAEGLREDDLGDLQGKEIEQARTDLMHDNPVPITGLTEVWCIQTLVRDHIMIVHIVQGPCNG